MTRYRTATANLIGLDRYFVIPDDGRPVEQFLIAGRRISDDIVAQCPSLATAERVAAALNGRPTVETDHRYDEGRQ